MIDCTNAVDYESGLLKPSSGSQHVAEITGGRVVKALHLFAVTSWLSPAGREQPVRTVAMCADDLDAVEPASQLVKDLGGVPAVIGGLAHARQLEGIAGFVMRLVAARDTTR